MSSKCARRAAVGFMYFERGCRSLEGFARVVAEVDMISGYEYSAGLFLSLCSVGLSRQCDQGQRLQCSIASF